jgi:hypothetical protein
VSLASLTYKEVYNKTAFVIESALHQLFITAIKHRVAISIFNTVEASIKCAAVVMNDPAKYS